MVRAKNGLRWTVTAAVACAPLLGFSGVNVLTYHNDNFRTGANLAETLLTPANVKSNTFGKLFSYPVDGYVYAQPLYVSALYLPGQGTHNVVFVATEHNTVYAFDADSDLSAAGGLLWQRNLGPSAQTPNDDFGLRYGGFQTIVPEVGITGTPVIDLASGTLYVDAFTHEGSFYYHRVHALNIANGREQPFSPVPVSASIPGGGVGGTAGTVHFSAKQQLQRTALTLAGGVVYVAYAGYDDSNPYHGWVIGFNATNLHPLPGYVFNTTPNATIAKYGTNAGEGGIWMSGCGLSVDANTNLFFAVGNGTFNALNNSSGTEYGDSFLRLSTSGGLAVADYFTPYNQQFLADNNLDVGSSGLLLLPDQPGRHPRVMVAGSKQAKLYVMNRDMMAAAKNHFNASGQTDAVLQTVPLGGEVLSTPAYFGGRIYTAGSRDVMASFSVSNGLLEIDNYQGSASLFPYPGATPSISANATSNGIVWAVQRSDPAVLVAYDAANLTNELYNSSQAADGRDQLAPGVKFAVPTVAAGKVYVGGQYALSVFGLLSGRASYDIWRSAHFGTNAANAAIAGFQADPDHDGIMNILEYAFGCDPNRADSQELFEYAFLTNHFFLTFRRNILASELDYVVQRADSLDGPWTDLMTYKTQAAWHFNVESATVSESAPSGNPPDQCVTVTVSDGALNSSSAQYFFRVLVTTDD